MNKYYSYDYAQALASNLTAVKALLNNSPYNITEEQIHQAIALLRSAAIHRDYYKRSLEAEAEARTAKAKEAAEEPAPF